MKSPNNAIIGLLMIVLLSGCAGAPVVQPTYQELQAARRHKKTAAILNITDEGSAIEGVNACARVKLENSLMRYFNLAEREKIENVLSERNLSYKNDIERYSEIGKILGADFLIFGVAAVSVSAPEIGHYEHKYDSGKFTGRIWEEVCAESEVGLKVVDVKDSIIIYSGSKSGHRCRRGNKERFKNESFFRKSLKARTTAAQFIKIADRFTGLQKGYVQIVSQSIGNAVDKLTKELRNFIPQTGQIVRFINERDVVINLGSAYGIKPGDILVVWKEGIPFTDPKTGISAVPKEKKAYLKVIKVTSGLSSIARVSGKVLGRLTVGDKVYTQR